MCKKEKERLVLHSNVEAKPDLKITQLRYSHFKLNRGPFALDSDNRNTGMLNNKLKFKNVSMTLKC